MDIMEFNIYEKQLKILMPKEFISIFFVARSILALQLLAYGKIDQLASFLEELEKEQF